MEMIIKENEVKFRQNANQIWYCEGFTINCKSIVDGVEMAFHVIGKINNELVSLNSTKQPQPEKNKK